MPLRLALAVLVQQANRFWEAMVLLHLSAQFLQSVAVVVIVVHQLQMVQLVAHQAVLQFQQMVQLVAQLQTKVFRVEQLNTVQAVVVLAQSDKAIMEPLGEMLVAQV
jgi:exonuclease VII small subunit